MKKRISTTTSADAAIPNLTTLRGGGIARRPPAERKPVLFQATEYDEVHSQVSPNGKWIAYTSNETGRLEDYVRSFPRPGNRWQISTMGGCHASWRADGRELYFLARVSVSGYSDSRNHYVFSNDGTRVLMHTIGNLFSIYQSLHPSL